jgi:hypothetical protein
MKNETSNKTRLSIDIPVWAKICKLARSKKVEPEVLASSFIQKVEVTPKIFTQKVELTRKTHEGVGHVKS